MADPSFADLTVRQFLEALGSDRPTPGGGSGAAVAGALGASLVRMLALLSVGRPKLAEQEPLLRAVAQGAGEAAERLLALADADARAYDRVSAAYRMPKATDAEKAERARAIQAALKGAVETPIRIMEECLETISLAKGAVAHGNPNALSDGAAGAELCRAGLTVGAYNVRINLVAIEDAAFARAMRTRLDEMLHMGMGAVREIDSRVQDAWAPPPSRPGTPRPA
jgi:formiminotetrahydrofolate cyclodeaminase